MRVILAISGLVILLGGVLLAIDRVGSNRPGREIGMETTRDVATEVEESVKVPIEEQDEEPIGEPLDEPVDQSLDQPTESVTTETPAKRVEVERLDGRSIRLDDRFVLRGNGTERDPFTISWELLASARETIDAAEGALDPPPYIELLNGAWVRIDGYYSTPLVTEEVHEVLLTLNRWDGCCIGLPPTPFDCVETTLRKPINMRSKHLVRFGTVTGRMSVQPFAIGNWLMGLYRLENATVDMGSM